MLYFCVREKEEQRETTWMVAPPLDLQNSTLWFFLITVKEWKKQAATATFTCVTNILPLTETLALILSLHHTHKHHAIAIMPRQS